MGRVADDEPPSKRVKVYPAELRGYINGQTSLEVASCSSTDSMARPLASQGDDEVVGSKGVVKKTEFIQIIAETLCSLGYKRTGKLLEEESGIPLHSSLVTILMQQIHDGKWDESVDTLSKLESVDDIIVKLASFIILEQKFFKLLSEEKIMDALKTLRTQIAPLCIKNDRVRELSSCIVSQHIGEKPATDLRLKSSSELLEELQRVLPNAVMIPEKRLVHLVEQALDLQRDTCRFHNSLVTEMSLLSDHQCGRDQIPSQTIQILSGHTGEVWILQFANGGRYLASASSDGSVIIWEVKLDGEVLMKHMLTGLEKPVIYIAWSPDDHQLLTCESENCIRRWEISTGECRCIYTKSGCGFISCGWAPDGNRIYSGATDRSISMWDLEGNELESWKGRRTIKTSDLGITGDGKQIVTFCKENVISLVEWGTKTERLIEENQIIVHFALSRDSKYLLVSLMNQEIHLWDIDKNVLVAKYKGHKRSRFIVRSCLGGFEQSFVASGSEDSQVYIWHRASGDLIGTLAGHSGSVNCVSWNPANPHMLASASDDHTIRIWGLSQMKLHTNGKVHTNGVCCNGNT
ncbi:hypothetical protein LIER_33858 [Lithospermum erythrorhizon]|uniref:CTLH domain-containing protein n=1 Tax=Lithospermum erythrorhizon TaxID=34254 RepID=A0AAV3RWS4_LITER